MIWKNILSTTIIKADGTTGSDCDLNKEFMDILSLSSFRRLQDKAQVFPLEAGDFSRTRLTHSLEVMSISEIIGNRISKKLIKDKIDHLLENKTLSQDTVKEYIDFEKIIDYIPIVLKSSALIHDLGNPPFGHIGEQIISDWFSKNLKKMYIKVRLDSIVIVGTDKEEDYYRNKGYFKVEHLLNSQQKNDLLNYEGNAQLLRLLSYLSPKNSNNGYSAALISTCMKYLRMSNEHLKDYKDQIAYKKIGHFSSENDYVNLIRSLTGTGKQRNPLTFLLEASDDTAYLISDAEDAIKKGLIDFNLILNHMKKISEEKTDEGERAQKLLECISKNKNEPDEQVKIFVYKAKELFIEAIVDTFFNNLDDILKGNYNNELLNDSNVKSIVIYLRHLLRAKVYHSKQIAIQKTQVHKILNTLLDSYVPASFSCNKTASQLKDNKNDIVCALFSDNYVKICKTKIDSISKASIDSKEKLGNQIYACLRLAIDEISGMTDLYATRMYEIVNATKEG